MIRLEITGGKGMTSEQFTKLREALDKFFDSWFHRKWRDPEASLSDQGMLYVAWGRAVLNDTFTERIEKLVTEHGYSLGYGEDELLIGLFHGW